MNKPDLTLVIVPRERFSYARESLERGTHEQLIKRGQHYATLYRLQQTVHY